MSNFQQARDSQVELNKSNRDLISSADHFFLESVKSNYSYGFDWLGFPIIQYPQDIVALQEIVFQVKPTLIIETGFARGGSSILFASLLKMINNEKDDNIKVLTIDIDFNKDCLLKVMASQFGKYIHAIEGSSIDKKVFEQVVEESKTHDSIMVVLDSMHTKDHVDEELKLYSQLVSKGSFICVMDTAIGYLPEEVTSDRPWSPSNSPFQSAKNFVESNNNFISRDDIDHKLLVSVAKSGYIQRVK